MAMQSKAKHLLVRGMENTYYGVIIEGGKNTLSDPLCEFNSIDKNWVTDRHSLISFISSGHSFCGRADGH